MKSGRWVWWLLVGIVGVVLVSGGLVYYLFYQTRAERLKRLSGAEPDNQQLAQNTTSEAENIGSLPEELTSKFDPTVNPVTLRVIAIDDNGKWWETEGMSPESWRGKSVTTRLTCPPWDTRISYEGSDTTKYTSVGKLKEQIDTLEGKVVIVSGVCTDGTCSKINKACFVSVLGETK